MKKILHIQVLPKLSGVQKISLEIFKGLSDDKYEKYILFSQNSDNGDLEECVRQFEQAGVKIIFSKNLVRNIGLKDLPALKEIYKLCKKEKFDIVHTHSTKPGIIGRIAATLARVPLVIHTVHGLSFHTFVKFPLWQFYWCCEMFASLFCKRITMVNKYYSKYFKWFKYKTSTIYNGLDFTKFPPIDEFEVKKNNKLPRILYVGRLDEPKDPLTLLKAIKIISNQYPEIELTMVGDGEKYNECVNYIQTNKLEKNVSMVGWKSNVSEYYMTHDIFAMTSIYESFGLIFLEAGYYGLPIVATNVEGIPEVVEQGKTGLLSSAKNPEAFAQNIIKLIENENLRKQMGQAGHEKVTTQFTSQKMVDQYKKIYELI